MQSAGPKKIRVPFKGHIKIYHWIVRRGVGEGIEKRVKNNRRECRPPVKRRKIN